MSKYCFRLEELSAVVQEVLLPLLNTYSIFTFTGPLGAGKTTVIKELLRQCGVEGDIVSPTFTYVQHYQGTDGRDYHHFDLYRIDSLETFSQQGFEEYLEPEKGVALIEWPEVLGPLLEQARVKKRVCRIRLAHDATDDTLRDILVETENKV